MTDLSRTLLHIGFQKAASTWLQHRLFPALSGVDLVPAAGRLTLGLKWSQSWAPTDTPLPTGVAGIRLLSDENLCGEAWGRLDNQRRTIDRLARVVPQGGRVLVVVRRQQDAVPSFYAQYTRMGGTLDLRRFLEPGRIPGYDASHLEYDRLCALVVDRFGPDGLTTVPMELISSDPDAFVGVVEAWAGRPVDRRSVEMTSRNSRIPGHESDRLRTWNRYVRRSEFSPRGLLRDANVVEIETLLHTGDLPASVAARPRPASRRSLESRLRAEYLRVAAHLPRPAAGERTDDEALVAAHVDRFRASNRRLQGQCPVPLEPLGYVL